ncbi:alpha/beta fold hydrolase [Streptomyces sp. AJS327]|uniref:alpha/beta fold hydrolase n=1 Tax=Streptomyces sp. AJS327 TaxID=2545265 RepID=UPI0015E00005|nr:alpha/beta fold hydrolase [Streptomyces sp. AJS327]MBA0049597.1 alpha/beta fold hydrolase [Streptomyces sp. AJS327]
MSTAPTPPGQHATATDGARIGFDTAGTGEPLVLLAGQANSRHWWDPVRADYTAAYTTITLDCLGTGSSDSPRDAEWSTRRFARDVIAVLDALGLARAHVYGTSMGGRIAQWVAVDHPERVGALVLGCTSGGGAGRVPTERDVLAALGKDTTGEFLTGLMVGERWRRQHPGPLPVLGDSSMSDHARLAHRRASAQHDAWAGLPHVSAPTLVLHGTDDRMTPPANGERLAARVPGATLRLLDGARHAYFLEHRREATDAVLAFLAAHPIPTPH